MRRQIMQSSLNFKAFVILAYQVTGELLDHVKRPNEGVGRVPRAIAKRLAMLVDSADNLAGLDDAERCGIGLWQNFLELHALAARELLDLYQSQSARSERVEEILASILFLFVKVNAFKSGSAFSRKVTLALIRSDSLQCYAQIIATWKGIPARDMEPKLRLLAQFSLIFSSCAQVTVGETPAVAAGSPSSFDIYTEFIRALSSSQLLEHTSRALLAVQESTHVAVSQGELNATQAASLRTGVMETCGCIVSALHAVAGKQGIIDCCWAVSTDMDHPFTTLHQAARDLMPEVAAVLSGPCLQFLLGRELIGARLRLSVGVGSRHGLPDAYLPEAVQPPSQILDAFSQKNTDRLLSRLGAASLVWQVILAAPMAAQLKIPAPSQLAAAAAEQQDSLLGRPQRQTTAAQQPPGTAAPAAAAAAAEAPADQPPPPPPLPPAFTLPTGGRMLYSVENVFDLVLEAIQCVSSDVPTEHLPGGSQLTLLEPALLLVELMSRMPPQHMPSRLFDLWAVVIELLRRRPQVRLTYAGYRPLVLIGELLTLTPERAVMARDEAPAAAGDGAGAAAAGGSEAAARVATVEAAGAVSGSSGAEQAADPAAPGPGVAAEACGSGGNVAAPFGGDEGSEDDEGFEGFKYIKAIGTAAPRSAAPMCAMSINCALQLGFMPALEQRLRGWCRGPATAPEDLHATNAVNGVLRRTGAWPALLAHGSLREGAAMITTLRRVVETIKHRQKLFRAALGDGVKWANSYQDAEIGMTAFLSGLLEQLGAVLLPPPRPPSPRPDGQATRGPAWPSSDPLALNNVLESDGESLQLRWLVAAGGRPPRDSREDEHLRTLTVFALTQWLPGALWFGAIVKTWFSKCMCATLSRWALEAALQCLSALVRCGMEAVDSGRGKPLPAAAFATLQKPDLEVVLNEMTTATDMSFALFGTGDSGTGPGVTGMVMRLFARCEGLGAPGMPPVWAGRDAWAAASGAGGRGDHSDGGLWCDYMSWVGFLISILNLPEFLASCLSEATTRNVEGGDSGDGDGVNKNDEGPAAPRGAAAATTTSQQSRGGADGAAASGGVCTGPDDTNREVLVPSMLDVLEVLVLATPGSIRECIVPGPAAASPSAASAPSAAAASAAQSKRSGRRKQRGGAAVTARSEGALEVRGDSATACGSSSDKKGSRGQQKPQAAAAEGQKEDKKEVEVPRIVVNDWLRGVMRQHGRMEVLRVLELWAGDKQAGDGGQEELTRATAAESAGRGAASTGPGARSRPAESQACAAAAAAGTSTGGKPADPPGTAAATVAATDSSAAFSTATAEPGCDDEISPGAGAANADKAEEERRAVDALRAHVFRKHNLLRRACLPSPWTATEVVAAAGVRLCSNISCGNMEGASEADLSYRKTCSRCHAVSYCCGRCQLTHWKSGHEVECAALRRMGPGGLWGLFDGLYEGTEVEEWG